MTSIAITISRWDVGTTAFVNGPGAIAYTAFIRFADTGIILIADAVRVCIVEAVAITIQPFRGVGAVSCGLRRAGSAQHRAEQLILGAICFSIGAGAEVGKELTGQLDGDVAIRGQLCDEDLAVLIRDALVIAVIEDVPEPSDQVVHDEVVSGFEFRNPVLVRTGNRADGGLRGAVFRSMSNGDPAVVKEVREKAEQTGHDAGGCRRTHRILMKTGGGLDSDDRGGSGGVHGQV